MSSLFFSGIKSHLEGRKLRMATADLRRKKVANTLTASVVVSQPKKPSVDIFILKEAEATAIMQIERDIKDPSYRPSLRIAGQKVLDVINSFLNEKDHYTIPDHDPLSITYKYKKNIDSKPETGGRTIEFNPKPED